MAPTRLEERVAALEQELARLKRELQESRAAKPWWERIAGTFQADPVYEEAMELGREYRRSTNPTSRRRKQT